MEKITNVAVFGTVVLGSQIAFHSMVRICRNRI